MSIKRDTTQREIYCQCIMMPLHRLILGVDATIITIAMPQQYQF